MEEKELSIKVLEAIKSKKITPKPKWNFLLKSYTLWLLSAAAIAVGSVATSVVLFLVLDSNIPKELSSAQQLVLAVPYFWVALLAAFLLIAWFNFSHTAKGYRYSAYIIILSSILVSLIFGASIYTLGGAERLESMFYTNVPIYQALMHTQGKVWIDERHGRIAGIAQNVAANYLVLKDFKGNIWMVSYPTTTPPFRPGSRLIIYGQDVGGKIFEAKIIQSFYAKKYNQAKFLIVDQSFLPERN
jgi:hypothetical protein